MLWLWHNLHLLLLTSLLCLFAIGALWNFRQAESSDKLLHQDDRDALLALRKWYVFFAYSTFGVMLTMLLREIVMR